MNVDEWNRKAHNNKVICMHNLWLWCIKWEFGWKYSLGLSRAAHSTQHNLYKTDSTMDGDVDDKSEGAFNMFILIRATSKQFEENDVIRT